jgi:hypothetical protein
LDKGHFAHAARKLGEAAAVAEQLHAPDCLIASFLRAEQIKITHLVSDACILPAGDEKREALLHGADAELFTVTLPAVLASLERRKAAGTLLGGGCRPMEVEWYLQREIPANAEEKYGCVRVAARREACTASSFIGYEAYLTAASCLLRINLFPCTYTTAVPPSADLLEACGFVAHDVKMMKKPRPFARQVELPAEPDFASVLQEAARAFVDASAHAGVGFLLARAWQRLERGGVLEERNVARSCAESLERGNARAAAAADAAAARGLRCCALEACAKRESHVSHFKLCSACKTVVYCSKAHQAEDWPSHKAACKTARKAAAEQHAAN